jgi:hypothetical protein
MSHDTIIKNFAEQKVNSRRKEVAWGSGNVFCEDGLIYSYGTHFPMAKFLGQQKGENFFIKNGDKYSCSTASHQSSVQHACKGPTVSRTAIAAAGFSFFDLTLDDIVCYRPDYTHHCYYDRDTKRYFEERHYRRGEGWSSDDAPRTDSEDEFYVGALEGELVDDPWTPPKQGMFISHYRREGDAKERIVSGYWHILGAVVLRKRLYPNGKPPEVEQHYLCSLDEGSYFVSQLPIQVKTVEQAFRCLKPKAVLAAERKGIEVKRQGEWFFVPTGLNNTAMAKLVGCTITQLKAKASESPLPRPTNQNSNLHMCRQVTVGDALYARGNVYHRWASQIGGKFHSTGQHKTIHLGDEWHTVHRNTEVAAWSQGGSFD